METTKDTETPTMKLEIPPATVGKLVKDRYGDEVMLSQSFKVEYSKCLQAFVHFASSL